MTLLLISGAATVWGASTARRVFDLPADTVDRSIRRFSDQCGLEIIYESAITRGLRARAVKGEMTADEALETLLAGTGLVVVRDTSGAFSIRRKEDSDPPKPAERPNGERAALDRPGDRPKQMQSRKESEAGSRAAGLGRESDAAAAGPTVLSPFEVSSHRDIGYVAASSLAGGRTDAPLRETAAAVSVITREFVDDIAGTSLREVAEWGVNTIPDYATSQFAFGDYNIAFRGLGASAPSRNYFLWYVDNDSFNTERYEFARGPNGVLFGDGSVGGIATTWTKRARFGAPSYSATARADSYGGRRATLDVNQPVGRRSAVRVNALIDRAEGWRDRTGSARDGVHVAGIVRLGSRANLRFEGEWGQLERPLFTLNYSDQASYWDRRASYDGQTVPSVAGTGITRISGSVYNLYIPAVPQAGFENWGTQYRSAGSGLALRPDARAEIPNFPVLPSRAFNLQPSDSRGMLRYYTYTAYLDFSYGRDTFAELAFYRSRNERWSQGSGARFDQYSIDVNQRLPDGQPNPKFGVPYADAQRLRQREENAIHDARVLATHRFETSWLDQRVSGIVGARLERFDSWAKVLRRTNGPNPNLTAPENQFFERRYWDEAGRYGVDAVPQFAGYVLDFAPTAIAHERKPVDHAQLASVSRLLEGKLVVTLGLRHDRFQRTQRTTAGLPAAPGSGLPQLGAVVAPPGGGPAVPVVGAKAVTDVSLTSETAGAVFFVFPWLGIFANTSETFQPPGSGPNLIDGQVPSISRSRGRDYGVKLDLLGGNVVATVNRYESRQVERLDFSNVRAAEINRLWTNSGRIDLASVQYRDTQSFVGRGYEMELTANPSPALRITANYARPETEAADLKPGLRAYVLRHRETWRAAANEAGQTQAAQMRADLAALAEEASGAVAGVTLNNTYRFTANVYTTYTFGAGGLSGLSIGAGANVRGRNKVGARAESPTDYLYAASHTLVSAHAAYRWRMKDAALRLQANVSNLLDNDALLPTTYADYRAGGLAANPAQRVAGNFRFLDPRKLTLSATVEF